MYLCQIKTETRSIERTFMDVAVRLPDCTIVAKLEPIYVKSAFYRAILLKRPFMDGMADRV